MRILRQFHIHVGGRPTPEPADAPTDPIGDEPITKASDDLLGRSTMATRIADILSAPTRSDGRVFAIRGAWGLGKSSLKNMVVERIGDRFPDVRVLDFNPWRWGDDEAITRALFTQMAGKLGGSHSPGSLARARALRRYGGVLAGGGKGAAGFGHNAAAMASLLSSSAILSALLGVTVPGIKPSTMSLAIVVLGTIALVVGWSLNWIGRDAAADSLDDVRADLQRRLGKLARPLVVFVDDIDRLEPEQIRLVVRQIKANASLPNINFVLLFQPSIVEAALAPLANGDGRDYLDKIVQANFDVPAASGDRLVRILLQQLAGLIDPLATIENGFHQTRWGNVVRGGMQPMIRSLRDSRRLISSIAIHLEMHRGEHALEVNIIDFVALEALRVFEPEFHRALGRNKTLLTQAGRFDGDSQSQRQSAEVQAILAIVGDDRRPACQRLLKELFPTIEWALGGVHYTDGGFTREWLREKRVCTRRGFDRYFDLQPPEDELTESDAASLMSAVPDAAAFADIVSSLRERGLQDALARRLDQGVNDLPVAHPERMLTLMFENGERTNAGGQGPFDENFVASWRAAIWYLRRLADSNTRRRAFETALNSTGALSVAATVIGLDQKSADEEDPRHPLVFSDGDRTAVTALWLSGIEDHAEDPEGLIADRNMLSQLFRWAEFSKTDLPRSWAVAQASTHGNVVQLLHGFLNIGTTQTFGDLVATRAESFHLQHFEEFLPIDIALAALSSLDEANLPAADRHVVELFRRHAERWRQIDDRSNPGDVDGSSHAH